MGDKTLMDQKGFGRRKDALSSVISSLGKNVPSVQSGFHFKTIFSLVYSHFSLPLATHFHEKRASYYC
jgi:hypothetical protein